MKKENKVELSLSKPGAVGKPNIKKEMVLQAVEKPDTEKHAKAEAAKRKEDAAGIGNVQGQEIRRQIRISVRALVEFILRSGDLDQRRGSRADKDAMQAGSRIHRKIQRQMGSLYQAEVPLKLVVPMGDFDCLVEGRADGIFTEDGLIYVDEIKGVYRDLRYLEQAVLVHRAQAMCYAWMYAVKQGLETIGIQMTYCNLETEEKRYFREQMDVRELEQWFDNLMKEYEKWAVFQCEWQEKRRRSIEPIQFPFVYREGQKDLTANVYRAIQRQRRLFIQAPTGVGKTMSAVFPAVKALGMGLGDKIFYLTAKTITRTVASEAFALLRQQGLKLKTVVLTAKEKLCICETMECDPDHCPYARGHYDRVNEAVYNLLTSDADDWSREIIEWQARQYQVCPFEMSLDLSTWADAVICDYNYVFDPNVRLKRFFSEGVKGEYLFLVDEAHNLVERGREMYSATLYKEDFLALKRQVKGRWTKIERKLERCNKYLLQRKRESEACEIQEDIRVFVLTLLDLMAELEKMQEEAMEPELSQAVSELYLQVRHFLNMQERPQEDYLTYTELQEDGRFKLRLYCVETARALRECTDKGNSAVFFSATLLPMPYYKHLLGAEDDYAIYAHSPFSVKKRLLLVGRDVSSRYARRGVREYERIAAYISKTVQSRRGNYLVFFPSYKMMQEVQEIYQQRYAGGPVRCLIQQAGMSEQEREEFLCQFEKTDPEEGILGFCIMGGVFSEGIDLKHEALIGSIIVGPGLPQICRERELLRRFYEERGMDGFAYAYQYPGMNKVLQAAGRVIRTQEDRGVILLLDERFAQSSYQRLFPREWEEHEICRMEEAGELLRRFWEPPDV